MCGSQRYRIPDSYVMFFLFLIISLHLYPLILFFFFFIFFLSFSLSLIYFLFCVMFFPSSCIPPHPFLLPFLPFPSFPSPLLKFRPFLSLPLLSLYFPSPSSRWLGRQQRPHVRPSPPHPCLSLHPHTLHLHPLPQPAASKLHNSHLGG